MLKLIGVPAHRRMQTKAVQVDSQLWGWTAWLRSLKGAVDAQKETIAAQREFIQGLQTILDASDTPKMLERVEAYKKFVDHEKERIPN